MDIQKNNEVDLLYLTNPSLKIKYNKPESKSISLEDIKFYRKRILLDTKEYLRGKNKNLELDECFKLYANKLIEYYKFNDKKDIIQEEYKSMKKTLKKKKPDKLLLTEENKLMMKKREKEKTTIEDFLPVIVKEKRKKKLIIPKKKLIDLKNPKYRNKKK